jgi:hypothetical protein
MGQNARMAAARAKRSGRGGARDGAGRPKEIQDRVDRTMRFEREDLDALDALAAERGVTAAQLVRDAVRSYLGNARRRRS